MKYQIIYEKILKKLNRNQILPGFEKSELEFNSTKSQKIAKHLIDRENRLNIRCEYCELKMARKGEAEYFLDVFDNNIDKGIRNFAEQENITTTEKEFEIAREIYYSVLEAELG